MATKKLVNIYYREDHGPSPKLTRLIQQMDEIREKWLFFNCDNKYSKGCKCNRKKLFYIDFE